MTFSPSQSIESWASLPVDDLGYFSPDELLILRPEQLAELVQFAGRMRWAPDQWRNKDHLLYKLMDPASFRGKFVMDFGCGLGIDAVQFVLAGAHVFLADMHPKGLYLAQQVVNISTGIIPAKLVITTADFPYFVSPKFDLFWSMGVLHHTPHIKNILKRVFEHLNPGGEARITLYSDRRWTEMMEEDPPEDTSSHPRFLEFIRRCDSVGYWADQYSPDKISKLVEDFAAVQECQYICNDQMIGVILKPKG